MNNEKNFDAVEQLEKNVINITVKLGVLLLLFYWCFSIIQPFITLVVWAVVIAVSLYPLYLIILKKFNNKRGVTAVIFTLMALILLLMPVFMLSGSMIEGMQQISTSLEKGSLDVPAPSENVKEWPIVGNKIYSIWQLASNNIEEALIKFSPQIKVVMAKLFSVVMGGGFGMLQFFISIIIAGVLMANAESALKSVQTLLLKLSPKHGLNFVQLSGATIRSVAQGVIGIGMFQALFVGLGFWAVDVPGAGLWALLVMILSIAQLPPFLVILPVLAYVYSVDNLSIIVLVFFTIWSLFGGIVDSLLKPFVMSRGVDTPMLIVMIGAIGGMIYSGILGLFTGAIVLSLGYIIYTHWLLIDEEELSDAHK